jgi:glutamate racemase
MIESCAKEIAKSKHSKISVWATKFVVENHAYKKMIQNNNSNITVEEITCQKLVPMIEGLSFTLGERNQIIQEYLNQTSKDSNALILGCTHYPLITEDLKNLANIETIDPADALIKDLEKYLPPTSNQGQISLYTTAEKEKLERFVKLYLQKDVKPNLINISKDEQVLA